MTNNTLIKFDNVSKSYHLGEVIVPALKNTNIEIKEGEFLAIAGPSGSGKTTMLNLIGCVDTASKGDVFVCGKKTRELSDHEMTELRLHSLGFIFQTFNLISVLSVYDNVEFPLLLKNNLPKSERKQITEHFIEAVGLKDYMNHRPNELSGGQRQRVAIARALVTKPKIVLADEPTANLDSVTGQNILNIMKHLNQTENTTFVFSTHDNDIIKQACRIIKLHDGEVSLDSGRENCVL
jgi:putative ABC transport system ATP-binding protein